MAIKFLNTVAVDTNVLYVDASSNRVGIGTTDPSTALDVYGTSDTYLTVRNSGGGYNVGIRMYGGGAGISHIWHDDTEANPPGIRFGTSANTATTPTTQMYIKGSDGNVGIGTTSPQQKLQVASPSSTSVVLGASYLSTNNNNFFEVGINANDGYLNLRNSGVSTTVHIDSDGDSYFNGGNVGIGTASPDATLHLSGISQTGATNVFRIENDTSNTKFQIRSISGDYSLQFKNAGNTTRVLLDSNGDSYLNGGNVGIGTTSPGVKLEVNGGNDNEIAKFLSTDDTAQISISDNDTDGFFGVKNGVAFISQTAGTPVSGIAVDSSGKVGIGTTNPGEELHISSVNPGVRLQDSDGTNTFGRVHFNVSTLQYFSRNDTSNGHHAWYGSNGTINTEFMRLRPTGEMRLNLYGSGTFTGTATQRLGVDSSGNVVEIPIGSGAVDGSGTANYVTKWTDADTIGNSIIYDDGTNVGIGTTSPTSRLEIKATSATHKLVSINRPASDTAALYLGNDSASPANGVISSNYSDLIFGRDQSSTLSEWMRIKRDGNVGIGTTSPTEKLDVNGNINIRSTASGIRGIKRNGDGYNLHLAGGSSLTGGSYVEVNGGSRGGVGNALNGEINFVSGGSYQSSQSAVVGNYNFKTQWNGGSATLMHIDSSTGNVGIGTTSPNHLLDVESTGASARIYNLTSDGNTDLYLTTTGTTGASRLLFGDTADNDIGKIIYRNNGDSMAFETNAGERMRITSTGNIGIGTTSPSTVGGIAKMTVNVGSGAASPISIVNGTTDGMYIRRYSTGGSYQLQTTLGNANSGNLSLQSYGGNVGIGTTSPEAKLDVEAGGTGDAQGDTTTAAIFRAGRQNVWFQNRRFGAGTDWNNNTFKIIAKIDNTSHQSINFVNDASYQEHIDIYTGNQVFNTRFNANGNVGIGTASPSNPLTVVGVDSIGIDDYILHNGDSNTKFGFPSNDTFKIRTSGVDRFNINSSGNVGIGTTSPDDKLDVNGRVLSDAFRTHADTDQFSLITRDSAGNSPLYVQSANSSTNQWIARFNYGSAIANAGTNVLTVAKDLSYFTNTNLGIGTTTPDYKLEVNGTIGVSRTDGIIFAGSAGTGAGNKITSDTSNNFIFSTSLASVPYTTSERMRIDNSGNVGIGTTTPGYKLHVNGGIAAGGKITYSKYYASLDTTGNAVAGLTTGFNGASAGFTFTCFGHGGYQKVVYSCYNVSGTWNTIKVIDEGTNAFDVEASANGTTITFTFKSTSGTKSYTPRVTVEATGNAINNTYA